MNETKTDERADAVPIVPALKARSSDTGKVEATDNVHIRGREDAPFAESNNLVNRIIKPTLEKNELEWRGWHAFRRGLAADLVDLGTPAKTVEAIARHADVHTTMQYYVEPSDGKSREAIQRLDSELKL